MKANRRSFLGISLVLAASPRIWGDEPPPAGSLPGGRGGHHHWLLHEAPAGDPQPDKTLLLDLPQMMRDDLDMRRHRPDDCTLPSLEPEYLDRLRRGREARLHPHQPEDESDGLDMASPDADDACEALDEYRRTIDAAQRLGCRWVRPAAAGAADPIWRSLRPAIAS